MKSLPLALLRNRVWIQEAACYTAAFLIFVLIVVNRAPNWLRPLSMQARFGFIWLVPPLLFVLYIAFRMTGWPGRFLSLTASLSLFSFALAGVWASAHTQSTYISGLIPLYDAQVYYIDALRLLAGRNMLEFSAARPLFAGFLATVLALTGRNLTAALMVLTAVNGLACFFAARAVQRTHGTVPAVFLLVFLFLYYRYRTVGTVMSENIGFAAGVVSLTLIWLSLANRSARLALYGLFIHTLALNARPGPLFILPALLLWGSWYYRGPGQRFSWRFLLKGMAVVGAGFAVNLLIKELFGVASGVPFSQLAYALYGLASGGNSWAYIFEVHPELRQMAHPEVTWSAYRLTLDLIRQHPTLILQGALHNWSALFSGSWYNLFSYIGGENSQVHLITRGSLYLFCLLGLLQWLREPADPYASLIVAGAAGIFLSVPFVPPTDAYGMRLYAASMMIVGLLPALGLFFVLQQLPLLRGPQRPTGHSQAVVWFGSLLVLLMLVGPFLVRGISRIPQSTATSCEQGMVSLVAIFDPGTHIRLIREKDPGLDWVPVVHYGFFKRNLHSLPDARLAERLETVEPHTSLYSTLDYRSNRAALVVQPVALLPLAGSTVELCGRWEDDPALETYSIFTAQEATILSRPE